MDSLKLNIKLLTVYYKQLKKDFNNENIDIVELINKYDSTISETYKNLINLPDGEKIIKEMVNNKTNKKIKKLKNQLDPLTEQEIESVNDEIIDIEI